MNFSCYIFILLFSITFAYPRRYSNEFLNLYPDEPNGKFGSPRQSLLRLMPIYHQQQLVHNPQCLPHGWTCGHGSPPCCSGLMCYEGNAKRGRHCVAKG